MMVRPSRRPAIPKPPTEEEEQAAVIQYRNLMARQIAELKWLHHVPNGGLRSKATAGKLVGQGVVKGIPDLAWDLRTKHYAGLRIEMKRKGGKLTDEQVEYGEWLISQGFKWVVCYSADEAIREVMAYWKDRQLLSDKTPTSTTF